MSLRISNHITSKQRELLKKLEYYGSYDLSQQEVAKLIDELLEEQRLIRISNEEDERNFIL